jgi:glutaredoxin
MAHVVLYARPGCHLCDVARNAIDEVRRSVPFSFEEVSIEGDDELELSYGIRIPVVLVDGEERFEIEVDRAALAELVRS